MGSPIFKVGIKDLVRGLIVVVLSALFTIPVDALANVLPFLADPTIRLMLSVIMGYLAKNLATDKDGKLGGKIQL